MKILMIILILGILIVGIVGYFYMNDKEINSINIPYSFENPFEKFCAEKGHGSYVDEGCIENGKIVLYDIKDNGENWIIDNIKFPKKLKEIVGGDSVE